MFLVFNEEPRQCELQQLRLTGLLFFLLPLSVLFSFIAHHCAWGAHEDQFGSLVVFMINLEVLCICRCGVENLFDVDEGKAITI